MLKSSSIAIIVHALGGGTCRHAYEMAESWCQQGVTVLLLEASSRLIKATIKRNGKTSTSFFFPLPENEDKLLQLMRNLKVGLIHYHHFIYVDEYLLLLPKFLKTPFFVTLHDYYVICPMINMMNGQNEYCEEKGYTFCNDCLEYQKNKMHNYLKDWPLDIEVWRDKWYKFLIEAADVFVPQQDVYERFKRYFPHLMISVFENPEIVKRIDLDLLVKERVLRKVEAKRRIGIIGTITPIKGALVILACAELAAKKNMPLQFILFGTLQGISGKKIPKNIKICGAYEEEAVYKQIVEQSIDFFWFPGPVPETYSYTLSIPVQLKIPIVGVDIGAVGNRIRTNCWGTVYPWDLDEDYLCKVLLEFDFMSYARKKEKFCLERSMFPLLIELYGVDLFNQKDTILFSECKALGDEMAESLKNINFLHIRGIEYGVIFRQKKSWSWKFHLLLNIDLQWFWRVIRDTDCKLLWCKILRILNRT